MTSPRIFKRFSALVVLPIVFTLFLTTELPAQDVVKIGVFGPFTGPAAEVGLVLKNGATLAAEEINAKGGLLGKKVEIFWGDDESKPEAGVSAFEKLVTQDKVNIVGGGINSSVFLAMMEAAAKYDVPLLSGGAVSVDISRKIQKDPKKYWMCFKVSFGADAYGYGTADLVDFLTKEKLLTPKNKTYAVIGEETDFTRSSIEFLDDGMKRIGWKKVSYELVKIDQADFLPQIVKIRGLQPGVVIPIQTGIASAASLCKSFSEAKIPSLLHYYYAPSHPDFVKLAGRASEGVTYITGAMIPSLAKNFIAAYKKRFNEDPPLNAGIQHDIMYTMFQAIQKAGSLDGRKLAQAILQTDYTGVRGRAVFNPENHTAKDGPDFLPAVSLQIQEKKSEVIFPAKYAEKKFVKPGWLK